MAGIVQSLNGSSENVMNLSNKPVWDLRRCDPRDHIGQQVLNDSNRNKRIEAVRIGSNLDTYVTIIQQDLNRREE